jgi:hypothetical protein
MRENHPQIENKFINKNYYGSDLNKFVATYCKKEMVVNNIDLIINDYKKNDIKIVESKHSKEKLSIGQEILLKKLSKIGIKTFVVYGDEPYNDVKIHSFQTGKTKQINREQLIKFLNNEL